LTSNCNRANLTGGSAAWTHSVLHNVNAKMRNLTVLRMVQKPMALWRKLNWRKYNAIHATVKNELCIEICFCGLLLTLQENLPLNEPYTTRKTSRCFCRLSLFSVKDIYDL